MMVTPALFEELLLQSHGGCLHLLPALPCEWPEGEVKRLVARGAYRVSLRWNYGQLIKAIIEVPEGMSLPAIKLNSRPVSPDDARLRIVYR